jgi:hypothetical protein
MFLQAITMTAEVTTTQMNCHKPGYLSPRGYTCEGLNRIDRLENCGVLRESGMNEG